MSTAPLPTDVHCLTCRALPGDPCRQSDGRSTRPHFDREQAARSAAVDLHRPTVDEARKLCRPYVSLEANTVRIVQQAVANDRLNRTGEDPS